MTKNCILLGVEINKKIIKTSLNKWTRDNNHVIHISKKYTLTSF